jgi:hypothetical protein
VALCLLDRIQPARIARPALDARPAPHVRPTKTSNWSWKAGTICKNRDARTGDAKPVRDVRGYDELGSCIHTHLRRLTQLNQTTAIEEGRMGDSNWRARNTLGVTESAGVTTADIPGFDDLVDLLRVRLGIADAANPNVAHSFKTLMEDKASEIAGNWYHEAFDELNAQGHLDPATSSKTMGDAVARLSADGRLYLRSLDESA